MQLNMFIEEDDAKKIVVALAKGRISHVTINY
jgi:hypothetical protein